MGLFLASLIILLLFSFLYFNARRSVLNEIRNQAKGIAIAVATGLGASDLEAVRGPEDIDSEPYQRIQTYLGHAEEAISDVRYVYTMRRSSATDATESDYEYLVDGPERDINGDGIIDREEQSETLGNPYSAAELPELIQAWHRPAADLDVSPDPPYPDLMSGYAPVRNARGQTVAIVGVDITAATVRAKLLTLRIVIAAVWIVLTLLMIMVVHLYYRAQEALETNRALSAELASRNEMLRAANVELAHNNEQFVREMKLAQSVQLGFLPKSFPRQDKIVFDRYYLTCEMLGGDLFDVFTLDNDHVGMYMADVAGHGVSAALISGLLKMAVNSVRDNPAGDAGPLSARLTQPDKTLSTINDMLVKELPEYEFITMIYAVLDIPTCTFHISSAGHLSPLKYDAVARRVVSWEIPTETALGLVEKCTYTTVERAVAPGDKILFFTDGLVEAMNERGEEFGEEVLFKLFEQQASQPPAQIISVLKQSVEQHRGAEKVSDDYSILVAEIR
ncbi:MAG: serine/threonine-protein phosphatase [Verrucomicrobia bacterium]|nr:serine/threonine-protein phosphatase [Verrucomicrobiota bacterium]